MENDKHLQGEIDGFWGDIKATQELLSYERESLAKALKDGLGEEIKKNLLIPKKNNFFEKIKYLFKRIFYRNNKH